MLEFNKFKIEPIDIKIRNRIGVVVNPNKIDNIDLIVTELIKEKEKYKEEIIKARNEFVFNFGTSSKTGAKFIYDYCNEKTK